MPQPPARSLRPRAFAALLTLAMLLLQAAWILTVPPYRATDEFDHAYRAEGVAHGDWRPTGVVADGRGVVTRGVPADIVAAAHGQCAILPYTAPANCSAIPGSEQADGTVSVATGAGTYFPALYWLMGTVARPFHGSTALYAMRILCSLICLALLFFAFEALGRVMRGRWALVGLAATLMPTLMFTVSMAAPNGVEICAGLAAWGSVLALLRAPDLARRTETGLFVLLGVAAGLLCVLRFLGPVWLLLIVVCSLVLGGGDVRELVRRRARATAAVVAVVVVTGLVGAVWLFTELGLGAGSYGASISDDEAGIGSAMHWPLWTLQLIDAAPFRDQAGPLYLYPVALIVIAVLLVAVLRRGLRRERWFAALAILLTFATPTLITIATVKSQGSIWQGRYAFPFVVGILPVCGVVLDRLGWAPQEGPKLRVIGLGATGLVQLVGIVTVLVREGRSSVSVDDSGWVQPPVVAVVALVVLAWAVLGVVYTRLAPAAVEPAVHPRA